MSAKEGESMNVPTVQRKTFLFPGRELNTPPSSLILTQPRQTQPPARQTDVQGRGERVSDGENMRIKPKMQFMSFFGESNVAQPPSPSLRCTSDTVLEQSFPKETTCQGGDLGQGITGDPSKPRGQREGEKEDTHKNDGHKEDIDKMG
eukprot:CAMPEP_0116837726 /NCGR_PEP_ID=MMETSP0418-20121206/8815_1 /TAXON_ID=1158023 /ORGANISM="Astrosyne radiata, Strain 13vi08-1A" /LENGTH=147 /DNA_ID=CAMNT_0004467645 /DNA_START=42 /DNA_END=485 /DNA_ORIENTATION=-